MNFKSTANAEGYLILRVVKGTTNFSGRSRRTEVLLYQIMVALAGVIIGFIGMSLLPASTMIWVISLLQILTSIPLFALMTRRLHDQNRSGWWGLLLPMIIILNLIENYHVSIGQGRLSDFSAPWSTLFIAVRIATMILLLVFIFWPGTNGPNRFGDDPRLAGA